METPIGRSTVVGILNVTSDSFSDGGMYLDPGKALSHAMEMVSDGADVIDIGGESTRPGADEVSETEELHRVIPIIERLSKEISIPISIDTYKPNVAKEALRVGARMLNDITGLTNPNMRAVAADAHIPVVLMHMQGSPKTMQENPIYTDVVSDIKDFFKTQIALAKKSGIHEIILDPGIGFGKTLAHNLTILKCLNEFEELGCPILVGTSRKAFIGALNAGSMPAERLPGTLASITIARMNGASYFRVHDVAACRQALNVADAVLNA